LDASEAMNTAMPSRSQMAKATMNGASVAQTTRSLSHAIVTIVTTT
jgi:hypothetical protein